jgi:hypothetical protein
VTATHAQQLNPSFRILATVTSNLLPLPHEIELLMLVVLGTDKGHMSIASLQLCPLSFSKTSSAGLLLGLFGYRGCYRDAVYVMTKHSHATL